jgi:predicted Zn finger-like uncharacterized protein
MKFTCDSCSAQYMISDDKVGPNGVKVRCKKCGKVVLVRRAAEVTPAATTAPAAATAPAGAGAGLDVELGHAFDNVFGGPPAPASSQPGADPGATQAMGSEDRARIDSAPAPAPAPTEWYVAIGQAQVGPLPLAEVKRKWEAGDVGPDSLVWRPGMTDWQAVTAVPELAGFLAPVPRPSPKASRAEPQPSRDRSPTATPAPTAGRDVSWKPAGASALAALASDEIAGRNTAEAKPAAAQAAVPGGVKSLVDGLPDGGGVDPTGALPLTIKALEITGEKKLERRSTVAHRAEEARHRRSVTRAIVVGVVLLAVVAGAAGGGLWYMNRAATRPSAVATASPPPAPAVVPAAPPAPQPAPPEVAAAPPAPPPEPAAPPPAEVAAAPSPAPEPASPPPARTTRTTRNGKREPAPARVAAAPAPAPNPAPAPQAPAPAPKKRNGLLDFDSSNDAALDEALGGGGGGGTGRTVYVPPARAGASAALPEKLSPSQINEAVAGRIDSLRRCVSEQKEREPGASGVLKMRWIIVGDGGVRDVKCLTSEYAQGPFAQCITGVVKTIKFPRSGTTGQEVTFPFSF